MIVVEVCCGRRLRLATKGGDFSTVVVKNCHLREGPRAQERERESAVWVADFNYFKRVINLRFQKSA